MEEEKRRQAKGRGKVSFLLEEISTILCSKRTGGMRKGRFGEGAKGGKKAAGNVRMEFN